MKGVLLLLLVITGMTFTGFWFWYERRRGDGRPLTSAALVAVGLVTDFFDALGIGCFATTSALFKLRHLVADEHIPGTLNVGHTLPVIVEAMIFISIIDVEAITLLAMISAAVLGAWIGAGFVARWQRRTIQIGLGLALIIAASLMLMAQANLFPVGGTALALRGGRLLFAVVISFILGALMTLGIGLYAPCMILVSLLGMDPRVAFPIMMGSCALLMPVAGIQFIRMNRYDKPAAIGLTVGGLPAVLVAAFVVKTLPLGAVRILVVLVVFYTAATLLWSARRGVPAEGFNPAAAK